MMDFLTYMPGILAAYSILFIAALSPGPAVALLIAIATNEGRSQALVATSGIALGSATINILTMLGVGLVLSQLAWGLSVLRIMGAAYLLWLAYGAFKKAINPPVLQDVAAVKRSPWKHFLTGYLLQVTNPKAIAFWLAISSIGAINKADMWIIVVYVFGAIVISFVCHGAWAVALSAKSIRRAYSSSRRWVEGALGAFFSFAAFKLATSED